MDLVHKTRESACPCVEHHTSVHYQYRRSLRPVHYQNRRSLDLFIIIIVVVFYLNIIIIVVV